MSEVFTRICAYSFRHPHFPPLHGQRFHGPFTATGTLPYPCIQSMQGQASAGRLIPTILGASTLDE